MAGAWIEEEGGLAFLVRLTPKGGRDAVEGIETLADGRRVVKARVSAPPEDGRANEALCALIAARLDAPASRVRLAGGGKSRLKQVAVSGDPDALIARLRAL